jgi:hypothetical protein
VKAARIVINLALAQTTMDAAELRREAIGLMGDERAVIYGHNLDHPEGPRGDQSESVGIG